MVVSREVSRSTAIVRHHSASTRLRLSQDRPSTFSVGTPVVLPPPDAEGYWKVADLDTRTLDKESPAAVLQKLADLSPEFSSALWMFARSCNPGFEFTALVPGSGTDPDSADEDPAGKKWLADVVDRLLGYYKSLDVLWSRLHVGAFLRGAYAAEFVLAENGRDPIDFATPDPSSFRFRKVVDPERGEIWQLGQQQGTAFVPLDYETIAYLPIDPFPGSPYGRPPAAPALFAALFLIAVLHDLRRVVQQQGWPRYDLSADLEKLRASMPEDILQDQEAAAQWINAALDEIAEAYNRLPPDGAFVHTDDVTVNRPTGAVDSSALTEITGLIEALERMLARALKTVPVMLGLTEGMSEANANRQYEAYIATIQAFQHHCESLVGHLFTIAAQAAGIQTRIVLRFAVNRAAEAQRDAITEGLVIANAAAKRDQGWNDQDTASREATGHDAVADAPVPAAPATDPTAPPTDPAAPADEPPTDPPATPAVPGGGQGRETRALPAIPRTVLYSTADRKRIKRKWDAAFPDYQGLLDATVAAPDPTNAAPLPTVDVDVLREAVRADTRQEAHDLMLALDVRLEERLTAIGALLVGRLDQQDARLEEIAARPDPVVPASPPQTINIDVPPANGHPRRIRKTVERDGRGQITGVIEEELPDGQPPEQ